MYELHTSDFDPCPGRAQLRRDGAFDGVAGTALVRGLMVHTALELIHLSSDTPLEDILFKASKTTLATMEEEGRQPSEAVLANLETMTREIHRVLEQYIERVMPLTENWTLLGCEVPVYWELRDDVHLSSHLDALFITDDGIPVIWDWKWRIAAAAVSDLSRSLQLACYWGAVASGNGLFQLPSGCEGVIHVQDDWHRFEPCSPHAAWVDLPSLKPYARATMGTDDEGRATQYVKGDPRPLSRVMRYVDFKITQLDNITAAALLRADMLLDGTAPFIPQGCSHCECEPWCPRFDMSS